jgi:hypothetical protein
LSKPWIAVGNDELGRPLKETATCPNCGEKHEVESHKPMGKLLDARDPAPPALQFVKCPINEESYLVGINSKELRQ